MTEMQGISKFSDLALAWDSYERLTFDKWIIERERLKKAFDYYDFGNSS